MRILFFTSIFPQPHNRLRGIFSLQLCRALAARHEVKVIAPWSWVDKLRFWWAGGADSQGLANDLAGLEVHYPCYFYPPRVMRSAYGWFMSVSTQRQLKAVLRDFKPDCIVSYWTHPDGAVAVRAAHAAGIPCAVMVGGSDVLLLARRGMRRKRIVEALQAADAVLPVGVHLRETILGMGIPGEKTKVVPRGIDSKVFLPGSRKESRRRLGIPEDTNVLLWVGNMVPVKGVDVLLAACERLVRRGNDLRLYLIGRGPLRNQLEAECGRRNLAGITTFVGPVPNAKLPDWYRAANVTVLPSRSEGVPNVLRESLACGTPFVASRVGGIPELAGDPMSELVQPGDAAALADAIHRAVAKSHDWSVRSPMSNSWGDSADRLTAIMEQLVERHSK